MPRRIGGGARLGRFLLLGGFGFETHHWQVVVLARRFGSLLSSRMSKCVGRDVGMAVRHFHVVMFVKLQIQNGSGQFLLVFFGLFASGRMKVLALASLFDTDEEITGSLKWQCRRVIAEALTKAQLTRDICIQILTFHPLQNQHRILLAALLLMHLVHSQFPPSCVISDPVT